MSLASSEDEVKLRLSVKLWCLSLEEVDKEDVWILDCDFAEVSVIERGSPLVIGSICIHGFKLHNWVIVPEM